jgi:hypothetical protein
VRGRWRQHHDGRGAAESGELTVAQEAAKEFSHIVVPAVKELAG